MNFVETNCTISHKGKTFESGGAYRVGDRALVYVKKTATGYIVTDWHGNPLGTASVLSTWETYTSRLGRSLWKSYRVHLNDGTFWHGRHNSDWADALKIKKVKS